jgi:pilus assembly protein CpaE
MAEKIVNVKFFIENLKIFEELNNLVSSLEGFHVQKSSDRTPCDILIIETGGNPPQDLQIIASAEKSTGAKEIFLTSPHFESDFMIRAIRLGVKEFFIQPINKEDVEKALLKFRKSQEIIVPNSKNIKRGKIINVIGSKGGIGTTTVAVNLAVSLIESKESLSVALMDMNLLFGEIPIFLNLKAPFNWGEMVRNISRADATYLMSVLAKHSSGIHVLPSPSGIDSNDLATPEIIQNILELMAQVFDFIIIDGGQSLDDVSLKILELSDYVFVVAILTLPCLTNLRKLLWTFNRLGFPKSENVRVLMNRYHKNSLISLKEAEKTLGQKIYSLVYNDYQTTMSAINQGKTLSAINSRAEITKNFKELASKLLELEKESQGGKLSH